MKLTPSSFLLEKKPLLKELIARLNEEYDYASVLATDVTGKRYSVSTTSRMVGPTGDVERGFVVRVFKDGIVSEYSFNEFDLDTVIKNIRTVSEEDRKHYKNSSFLRYKSLPKDEPLTLEYIGEAENDPNKDDSQSILEKLQVLHNKLKEKSEKLVQVDVSITVTQVNKLFLSKNRDLYQSYAYANGYTVAVASDGENTKVAFIPASIVGGSELVDRLEEETSSAVDASLDLLKSERMEPGEYEFICDPDFTGLIAHEAFGHGAEMDMFLKERAKGKEYLGKRVASDLITMHDGAKAYNECSSYLFDDEGNLGTDTIIIDKGIFKTGMVDELSALQLGVEPTGNGKRETYKRKAYTRMTNTFFEGGDSNLEDMIRSMKKGYLLEGLQSGMEDPKNWGIQCVASLGREIIDGKLTGKVVSPVVLTGYVPDLLESVSMVSKDLKLSGSGYCGKGWKEYVKTSTGGSYLKARGRLG
ncbi:TldD/PmbA family protein [Guggenheimella bovis]